MEKYINKSALVAEIRKRLLPVIRDKRYDEWEEGQNSERIAILDIINTLEVKEVDLEKEYKKFIHCDNGRSVFETAKYFFELGMAVSNSIEYVRTDAFIEKAKKYVANHFLVPGMDNEINDFVNYMKE